MAIVQKCLTSTRPPTPATRSWERTAVRGHSELVWESLALWCSAWVASFLGWARCHRIPRARRGATMLCTCRAALGQGDEITVRACVRGGGGGGGRQAMARQLLNGLLIHALLSLSFHPHPRTPRLRVILPAPRLHHRECCPLCRWVGQRLPDGSSGGAGWPSPPQGKKRG